MRGCKTPSFLPRRTTKALNGSLWGVRGHGEATKIVSQGRGTTQCVRVVCEIV